MRYNAVVVCGESFTRKQLEERVNQMLADTTSITKTHNQRLAREIVSMYPKVYEHHCSVSRVFAAGHPEYGRLGKLCMHVLLSDGTKLTVSRNGVVSAVFNPELVKKRMPEWRLDEAMRKAVDPQKHAFKDACMRPDGSWLCQLCPNVVTDREEAHADHFVEFYRLKGEYIQEKANGDLETLSAHLDADDWAEWHRERVKWRLLCKGCNLGRKRK